MVPCALQKYKPSSLLLHWLYLTATFKQTFSLTTTNFNMWMSTRRYLWWDHEINLIPPSCREVSILYQEPLLWCRDTTGFRRAPPPRQLWCDVTGQGRFSPSKVRSSPVHCARQWAGSPHHTLLPLFGPGANEVDPGSSPLAQLSLHTIPVTLLWRC